MKKSAITRSFLFLLFSSYTLVGKDYRTTGSVERLDASINQLIPLDAKIEILAEGYDWSEGPVWISQGDFLLYSDVPTNKIYKWKEGEGASVYLDPSGYTSKERRPGESGSNGLTLDEQGRLIICQHGDRRVARMNAPTESPRAVYETLAGKYKGKRFNSPNDLVYNQKG
jgi:gluconolactonase